MAVEEEKTPNVCFKDAMYCFKLCDAGLYSGFTVYF